MVKNRYVRNPKYKNQNLRKVKRGSKITNKPTIRVRKVEGVDRPCVVFKRGNKTIVHVLDDHRLSALISYSQAERNFKRRTPRSKNMDLKQNANEVMKRDEITERYLHAPNKIDVDGLDTAIDVLKDKTKRGKPITKEDLEELTKTEAYRRWLEAENKARDLRKKVYEEKDPKKQKAYEEKLREYEDEANELYEVFREIIKPEIIGEETTWKSVFLEGLRESHRFKYRTIEDLRKEGGRVEKIKNPYFNILFGNAKEIDTSPVIVDISEDGEHAYLCFDNKGSKGYKTAYGSFGDYQDVVRNDYGGKWDKQKKVNIIPIASLNQVLNDLRRKNPELTYALKKRDEKFWKSKANIPKAVVSESSELILETDGKNVFLKGDPKRVAEAKMQLNAEYTRRIKRFNPLSKKFEEISIPAVKQSKYDIGLLDESYWYLEGLGFSPAIEDSRPRRPVSNPKLKDIELRDYQRKAITEALAEGDGLMVSPTGSGKTEIAIGITSGYLEGAKKLEKETGKEQETDVVFFAHRGSLTQQAEERFEKRLGVDVGRISGHNKEHDPHITDDSDINIASLQSVFSAMKSKEEGKELTQKQKDILKVLEEAEVIIQDEAHHVTAKSYQKVFTYNPTRHKYGLTATPDRYDTEAIMKVMKIGSKRDVATLKELEDRGTLMKPKVLEYRISRGIGVPMSSFGIAGYQKERKFQIINNVERNERIISLAHELAENEDRTTIIYTAQINHAKKLQNELKKQYGKESPLLIGAKKPEEREEIIKKLKSEKQKIAIATTSLLGEGFDLPELDAIIIADANGSSKIDVLQRAGRVMRTKKGKKQPLIIEFNDQSDMLGRHMDNRRKHYEETEAFDYEIIQ